MRALRCALQRLRDVRECMAEAFPGSETRVSCNFFCRSPMPSAGEPTVEPMFESRKTRKSLAQRIADATDLMIDFAVHTNNKRGRYPRGAVRRA